MKKFKKWFLLTTSSALPAVTLPIALSAEGDGTTSDTPQGGNTNPSTPGATPGAGATPSQPREVAADFGTFQGIADQTINNQLGSIIDNRVAEYRKTAGELLKQGEDPTTNDRQSLVRAIYLQKVADYLEKNKDEILKNPEQYGFNIVYPKVISRNRDVFKVNAQFNGQEYPGVSIGKADGTSYNNPVVESPTNLPINNTITKEELEAKVSNYFNSLLSQADDIFANQTDIPHLSIPKDAQDARNISTTSLVFDKEHNGIDITLPQNYSSWNDYIRDKILNRYTAFDLLQNSKDEDQNSETPPPIVPDQQPPRDEFLETDEIQNVPALVPFVTFNFYDSFNPGAYQGFVDLLRQNPQALNNRFKFDNPIFTRYKYEIITLEVQGNKLIATVKITDKLSVGTTRSYSTEVVKLPTKAFTKAKEVQIDAYQATFSQFYRALGITDDINIKALGNNLLITTVFNMISEANKLKDQEDFVKILNSDLDAFAKTGADPEQSASFKADVVALFLKSLDRTDLKFLDRNYGYFDYLVESYRDLFAAFKASITNDKSGRKQIIAQNFAAFQKAIDTFTVGVDVFDKSLTTVNSDLGFLKGLLNSNFDVQAMYDNYVQAIAQVRKTFVNLANVAIEKALDPARAQQDLEVRQFITSAKELAELEPYGVRVTKQNLLVSLGGVFAGIASLLGVISLILVALRKRLKKNLSKNKMILISVVATIILIIAIVLIVIGTGGGL